MTTEEREMTLDEKIVWMRKWAAQFGARIDLETECGFGRECVGLVKEGKFPDYEDDVWVPDAAYHKHPCVAVLGAARTRYNSFMTGLGGSTSTDM